jgi:hypothetical protein
VIALGSPLGRSGAKRGLGCPCKCHDALQRASQSDREAAGQFLPPFVLGWLGTDPPFLRLSSSHCAKIGSVPAYPPPRHRV